jgi:type II secretory pathway predicted ATPase ExeA
MAAELREKLSSRGFQAVFLDFDPEHGIPAGRNWETELYKQLRSARAVIVLVSRHSMDSQWVFSEITVARSLGKPLLPIKVGTGTVPQILAEYQILDLTLDKDAAYERLWRALNSLGLDPTTTFDWDSRRPPYPGLSPFDEGDAAVFFGRDAELQEVLERLDGLRIFRRSRNLLIVGPSGSGKTSLLRAGLLPRLRRSVKQWLVLAPFRPLTDPLEQLAGAFAQALARHGVDEDWTKMVAGLQERGGKMLNELIRASARHEATVVVAVDQAEELMVSVDAPRRTRFLRAVREATELLEGVLLFAWTLRSDIHGDYFQHPELRTLQFEYISVPPMSDNNLIKVIRCPAELVGI